MNKHSGSRNLGYIYCWGISGRELNDWLDVFRSVKGFESGHNSVRSFIQLFSSSLLNIWVMKSISPRTTSRRVKFYAHLITPLLSDRWHCRHKVY